MPAGTRSEIVSPSTDINHNGLAVTHQHLSGLYTPFEMLAMLNHAECISRTLMCKQSEYLGHTSKTNPPPKYVPYPFLTASEDKHFWRQGVQWNFFWEVCHLSTRSSRPLPPNSEWWVVKEDSKSHSRTASVATEATDDPPPPKAKQVIPIRTGTVPPSPWGYSFESLPDKLSPLSIQSTLSSL